ncbi:MAG: serine hydrolase, partial [Lachnospiraceae bacterium]|nr:serine hydrolase [Lachnospiraceae bacterium]
MNFEKITTYLDSLLERDIPSIDCIIYDNHKQVYRHMSGTTDVEKKCPINGNEMYLM